jgi:alpha-L-fucosidase
MQGRSGTGLFRIEGWDDWTRLKGKIVLLAAPGGAAGSGTGLRAEYFANPELAGAPVLTRTDPRVWFEAAPDLKGGLIPATWGEGSPAEGIPADQFSVRWTGEIEARFSEDYVLVVESAAQWAPIQPGPFENPTAKVMVWLGDQLVIEDDGTADRRGARIDRQYPCRRNRTALLRLEAGKRYPLRIEYVHGKGVAGIHLMWESRTQERQHVPSRFLYAPSMNRKEEK